MSQFKVEVRGHFSYQSSASRRVLFFAGLVDFFLVASLHTSFLILAKIPIFPSWIIGFTYLATAVSYWLAAKILFGKTLGHFIWNLKNRGKFPHALLEPLYQADVKNRGARFRSQLGTLATLLAFGFSLSRAFLTDPLWSSATHWKIAPYLPPAEESLVAPFFYILASWPKKFDGRTVFYSFPYEKGPPSHFIGHIVAHWATPNVKLTLEGPKTPKAALSQSELKRCILGGFSFTCLYAKEASLRRHISGLQPWKLRWFSVENPYLPPEDQPQGIYLSTSDAYSTFDHFILVQPGGVQQTLTLERSHDAPGDLAFKKMQEIVGSIRSLNELEAGRAWINQKISGIRLEDLKQTQDQDLLSSQLAEIQGILLSKISVDPASFDSYFHLAGTAHLLAKHTANHRDAWGLIALQNLQTSFRFASDVAPTHPKIAEMQELWLDAKKH